MHYLATTLLLASALSSAAASALKTKLVPRGVGGVSIYNNCGSNIYTCTVAPSGVVHKGRISPHQWYWEPYLNPGDRIGTSIKMSSQGTCVGGPITQLEYSFANGGKDLWYDVSNVDCGPTGTASKGNCPFYNKGGMFLRNDDQACPTVECASGDIACRAVYNLPSDNWANKQCVTHQNMVFYACSTKSVG